MGVDEDDRAVDSEPPPIHPDDDVLGFRNRVIVGTVFAICYITTFGTRTGMLAGVVSGVLGGVVIFLLLKEVDQRRKRRRH